MDAFIYFIEPLNVGLDEIEDALDEALSGKGGVTGSGTGQKGSNIDVEIKDNTVTVDGALAVIRDALRQFHFPISAKIKIAGAEYSLRQPS
jgi:hypothetical protein